MVKLYRSSSHPHHWIAYSDVDGWVVFPANAGGWEHRHEAVELHPDHLSEIPLWLSFNTGLLEEVEQHYRRKVA